MKRVTLRIPEPKVDELDRQVNAGEFPNRSEAIRTAVREMLDGMDDPGHQMWAKGNAVD